MNIQDMAASYEDNYAMAGEERSRNVNNNYVKGSLFLLFVLTFVLLVVRVIMNPGTFPVRSVRIEGEFRHLSPGILKEIVTDVVRGGFFDVNVETIQKVLMKNPWVDKVTVLRVWPDGLKVQVKERVPVARWKDKGLLSSEAAFFIPEDMYRPENLPVFSGPDNTYRLLLTRYILISEILGNKGLEVTELTLNDRRAWEFRLRNGITVFIGKGQIENRINRFADYAWPALKNNMSNITSVDMRYTNGFVVTWNANDEQNFETGKEEHG
jgi:cell division protein FtsQ